VKPRHHVMIAIAALLTALVLFFWPRSATAQTRSPAATFEQRCQSMRPSVSVLALPPTYRLVNNLSTQILNTRATYASSSHSTMGMTASRVHVDVSVDGPSLLDVRGDRECIAPRIDVVLALEPLEVYVAREFSVFSCAYREVFKHEMQHVKLYTEELRRIEGLARAQLQQRHGQLVYGRPGQGLAAIQDEIDTWLTAFLRAEMEKVELLQVQFDTYEETEKLSHACLGEVAMMMGSSF
jgi:hypothetical protein